MLKKLFLGLYMIFAVLTFCGMGYVLYMGGKVSAGYAVVPMLFGIIFASLYHNNKNTQ